MNKLKFKDVKRVPNQFNFLNDLDIDQDVKSRLAILLQNVVNGSKEVFRTPLGGDQKPEDLLAKLDSVLENAGLLSLEKPLVDLEMANKSKFGPMSLQKTWEERRSSILDYFSPSSSTAKSPDDLLILIKDKQNLRPVGFGEVSKRLKNNTNSGLPFYCRKGKVKERVLADLNKYLERKDPCIMFTRTQEQGKTRLAWGFPIADTAFEMSYYRPLLDYQRRLSWRSVLVSNDMVSVEVTKLIDNAIRNGYKLISIDFSAYDASIKPELQKVAFHYIKQLFQSKYHSDIDKIFNRFSSIGLITPEGVWKGSHGVPSGSTFTNEVDSIVQHLIASSSGNLINTGLYQIQGDDGAYAIRPSEVEKFLQNFVDFGLNVNKDKSYVADDYLIYLQCLYHDKYRNSNGLIGGIYPIYRAMNRIIYQERWSDFEDYGMTGKDYYAIRSISILENCKHHPLFEVFVKFIYSIDKYHLQVSQRGITQYIEMMSEKLGTEDMFSNQPGDNFKGIRNFETFKLIRKFESM